MSIWRTTIAIAAIVTCPSYLLLAQPAPGDRPIGILLAAGDVAHCDDPKKKKQETWRSYPNKTAAVIRNAIKEARSATPPIPIRVLALGDLAYADGTAQEFKCFKARWSGFDDVMLPVPGNHEYRSPGAAPYFANFTSNVFVNQNGKQKGYFALNFPTTKGPWRLIGLNAHVQGKNAMPAQLAWLEQALAINVEENKPNCVLAFWHAPTFTSGRHGHDYKTEPNAPLTTDRPMQAALRALYRHGASVVLGGHEHNYEQLSPHDPDGNAATDGIRAFIVGTGGTQLTQDVYDNVLPISEGLYGRTNGIQGVLKFELFENRYQWQFLAMDGTTKLPLKTVKDDCRPRKKAN